MNACFTKAAFIECIQPWMYLPAIPIHIPLDKASQLLCADLL